MAGQNKIINWRNGPGGRNRENGPRPCGDRLGRAGSRVFGIPGWQKSYSEVARRQVERHGGKRLPALLSHANLFLSKGASTASFSRSVLLPPLCFILIWRLRETSDP